MNFFSCKHPAKWLMVAKESTETAIDDDFKLITHHLLCASCGKTVDVKYTKMIGGVEAFLARKPKCPA